MKKNFFKKLSFVMALALLISCIAPAAGVFAAAKPALSYTSKVLHLSGEPSSNEYDFWVKNKQSGWKYVWSSNKTSVAKVDKATGLTTAVGVGTAKVTVKITKAGKAVATLSAKVTVLDNIKTVTVANPTEKSLKVNEEYDFNRNFETLSGSTTKTSSITRWTVNSDKATVTDAGVFKATEAGEYKVTATAFQSSYTYGLWTKSKDTKYELDTDVVTVTVDPSIVATKQVDSDTFTVEFDSDMSKSDIKTASLLYRIEAGKPVSTGTEKIKSVTLDTTGKIATVDTFVTLNSNTSYNFVLGKLTSSFTSATKKLSNIAGITFNDFNVDVTNNPKDMLASVVAFDSNGVVIYTGTELNTGYLTFTYGGDLTKGNVSGTNAYIYAEGTTAKVTAKFSATVYDDVAKAYKTLTYTDDALATGVKTNTAITTSSLQYAAPLASDGTAAADLTYSATGVTVAAKDSNKIYVKYTNNNALTTNVYYTTGTTFTFKSTDADKLLISGNYMYPITTGTVTVLVYNGTTAVGAFDVTIVAARSFANATPDKEVLTVGNSTVDTTGSSATVTIADSLGKAATATTAAVTPVAATSSVTSPVYPTVTTDVTTAGKVIVTAKGHNGTVSASVGYYSYKVTITSLGTTKDVYFTINVVDATSVDAAKVSFYQLELGKTAIDVKGVTSSAISVDVYGYNTSGVKVAKLNSTQYDITVKDASGNNPALTFTNTSIPVVTSASGSAVTADAVGTYVVTASVTSGAAVRIGDVTLANGAYLSAGTISVTDTTTTTYTVDSFAVTAGDVISAVKAAFTFSLNGSTSAANEALIAKVDYSKGATTITTATDATATVAVGDNVYVSAVYFQIANADGSHFLYKFDVNKSITIK